ncbi:hypothetical protein BDW66DRAFT_151356 [Aspergillus desertorum]
MPLSAARIYRIHLAWQLESVFILLLHDHQGGPPCAEIRDTTHFYIENNAPLQYREIRTPDYEARGASVVSTRQQSEQTTLSPTLDTSTRADVIILTGFLAQRWLYPISVKGVDGKDLHEVSDASGGAEACKGTVAMTSQLLHFYEPNAAPDQRSAIFHSKCQITYTCRLLRPVLGGNADSIMMTPEAQKRDLEAGGWTLRPRRIPISPGFNVQYWLRTTPPRWGNFEIKKSRRSKRSSGEAILNLALPMRLTACAIALLDDGEKIMAQISTWGL